MNISHILQSETGIVFCVARRIVLLDERRQLGTQCPGRRSLFQLDIAVVPKPDVCMIDVEPNDLVEQQFRLSEKLEVEVRVACQWFQNTSHPQRNRVLELNNFSQRVFCSKVPGGGFVCEDNRTRCRQGFVGIAQAEFKLKNIEERGVDDKEFLLIELLVFVTDRGNDVGQVKCL